MRQVPPRHVLRFRTGATLPRRPISEGQEPPCPGMLPKKKYSSLRNDFHYPYIIAQPPFYVIRFSEDFLYKFLYVLKCAL